MTTIIVTHDTNELDEYDFDVEMKTITVGRRSTNDVCVPHLSVSGNHCQILITDSGSFIEDLNSTNGTYINGRLVNKQRLNDGDDVVIGKARLTFLQPQSALADAAVSAASEDKSHITRGAQLVSQAEQADVHQENHQKNDTLTNDNIKSEFAGDYYEPDDAEIAAMIDVPADTDDEDFDPAEAGIDAPAVSRSSADTLTTDALSGQGKSNNVSMATAAATGGIVSATAASEYEPEVLDNDQAGAGAIIEIKNGAKSGQVLPIDKPVTTLGRPGIQIAAIMKKPEGYFLMHIESEDRTDRPRLNDNMIGDDPVLLSSGDSLNVAGIDVQFMLS